MQQICNLLASFVQTELIRRRKVILSHPRVFWLFWAPPHISQLSSSLSRNLRKHAWFSFLSWALPVTFPKHLLGKLCELSHLTMHEATHSGVLLRVFMCQGRLLMNAMRHCFLDTVFALVFVSASFFLILLQYCFVAMVELQRKCSLSDKYR